MNTLRKLLIIILFAPVTHAFCQLPSTISLEDFKGLIPILKNDSDLFCNEIDRLEIGFFPTSELVQEFIELGMPSEVIICLKANFPNNLKFHVILFDCFAEDCENQITKKLSEGTKEAIFDEKSNNEEFRAFSRKEIVDDIKDRAAFSNEELPTVFLTGTVHMSDSSFTAEIRLKYQNQHSVGGQPLAVKDFEIQSAKRIDVQEGCKKIAIWALDQIEKEIND